MKIKIHKIKPTKKNTGIVYEIDEDKRSMAPVFARPECFQRAIDACANVALNICELDGKPDEYTVTCIEMGYSNNKKSKSESCEITIERPLKVGKFETKSTKRYLSTDKKSVVVLDDISQAIVRDALDCAEMYVRSDRINIELYSQADISLEEGAAKEVKAAAK